MVIKMATTEYNSEMILFWKGWQISNKTHNIHIYLKQFSKKNNNNNNKAPNTKGGKEKKKKVYKNSERTDLCLTEKNNIC